MSHLDVGSPSLRERSSSSHIAPTRVKRWNEGVRNSQQLWRELQEQGSKVSAKTVSRFVGQLRKDSGTARSAQARRRGNGLCMDRRTTTCSHRSSDSSTSCESRRNVTGVAKRSTTLVR